MARDVYTGDVTVCADLRAGTGGASSRRWRSCTISLCSFLSFDPKGAAIESFADRLAASMGDEPRDSTAAEVAEVVQLLSNGERRRLVRAWAERYPDRWHTICSMVGDDAVCEQTLVSSAVRAAVADRVVCPSGVAAELEDGALERSPGAALALALSPRAIWSYEEVLAPDEPSVTDQHVARVRRQARRLRRRRLRRAPRIGRDSTRCRPCSRPRHDARDRVDR